MASIIPTGRIDQRIVQLPGQRVMLSPDLATLYGVEPRALVQAVKRNLDRFPANFMFQLTKVEAADLATRLDKLERKYDGQFAIVFDAIRAMMTEPDGKKKKPKIGFGAEKSEK